MISKEEVLLVRDRVADFAIVFTDAILEGDETMSNIKARI
jgi:hypothetical protein